MRLLATTLLLILIGTGCGDNLAPYACTNSNNAECAAQAIPPVTLRFRQRINPCPTTIEIKKSLQGDITKTLSWQCDSQDGFFIFSGNVDLLSQDTPYDFDIDTRNTNNKVQVKTGGYTYTSTSPSTSQVNIYYNTSDSLMINAVIKHEVTLRNQRAHTIFETIILEGDIRVVCTQQSSSQDQWAPITHTEFCKEQKFLLSNGQF